MVEFLNISFSYGKKSVLKNLNLSIPDKSIYSIVGPNGAGKTTLLRILMTLIKPKEGIVKINGDEISRNNRLLKQKIGYVPQRLNLDKTLTVKESLYLYCALYKINPLKIKNRLEFLLEKSSLTDFVNLETVKLSGGMKRKLMLIQALLHEPKLLVLDEPTVGIDSSDRRSLWDLLKEYCGEGSTVLFTTHYIEEAQNLADTVAMMAAGKIITKNHPVKLISKLGMYTVEYFDGKSNYKHFKSREDARIFSRKISNDVSLRKTTLEDVYIEKTGRRVS